MRSALFVSGLGPVIAACPWASAQCEPEWLPGPTVPGIHAGLGAMIKWDPDGAGPEPFHLVVYTGEYASVGNVPVGPFAEWDGAQWKDGFGWTSYPVAVATMTYYNGQLIAGGSTAPHYYLYEGSLVFGFDGSSWASLGQGPHGDTNDSSASVNAFAEFQGELVAAGHFNYAQGQTVNNIARWNGSTWQSLGGGMSSTGAFGGVKALAVYQGQLVAAGLFSAAGGQPVSNIARWNGTSWQPLGTGIVGAGPLPGVRALIVHNLGLIAAGAFTSAGGQAMSNIARWDGASWSPLGAGVDGSVNSLAGHNGSVIVGGDFDSAGGQPANDIARWDGAAWSALGAGIGGPGDLDHVSRLHVYKGLLIAGGKFASAGGVAAQNIAAWNPTTTQWSAVASGGGALDGEITALQEDEGELVAAGHFYTPQKVINVVRRAGAAWEPMGSGVVLYHPAVGVHSGTGLLLVSYRDDPILAGHFTHVGGVPASNIARWDGAAWLPLGPGLIGQYGYGVKAMAVHNDGLVAGGLFTHAGAQPVNYIARWDGETWSSLGGGVTIHIPSGPQIGALTVYGGDLIAAGSFSKIGGVVANRIARWDGASWAPMGGGLPYHARQLAVYNADLIAFLPTGEMSRWTGAMWQPLSMGVSAVPDALLVYRGELVLGPVGSFNGVARWNGTVLQPLGSGLGPGAYPRVNALVSHDGELIVGGQFLTAGGAVSLGWARWGCACYADCNNNQVLGVGDFACFQTRYVLADPYADCNEDTALTIADFGCFQTKFVSGCP